MTWVLDLDGVVWRGSTAIAGSADAVATLRRRGLRVVFLTNNSEPTVSVVRARLADAGIVAGDDDVITSAQAAATLVRPGERAYACAGPGVVEALQAAGAVLVDAGRAASGEADVVVVGRHSTFDFAALRAAARALHRGARLVATNLDPTYPVADGLDPGNGAIVAAIATAGGVEPVVAGKPEQPMADLVAARTDDVAVVVGDQPMTDGVLAQRLGVPFGLVLTGVTQDLHLPVEPPPALVAADLRALVDGWPEAPRT